jgi:hypothetical protein
MKTEQGKHTGGPTLTFIFRARTVIKSERRYYISEPGSMGIALAAFLRRTTLYR